MLLLPTRSLNEFVMVNPLRTDRVSNLSQQTGQSLRLGESFLWSSDVTTLSACVTLPTENDTSLSQVMSALTTTRRDHVSVISRGRWVYRHHRELGAGEQELGSRSVV